MPLSKWCCILRKKYFSTLSFQNQQTKSFSHVTSRVCIDLWVRQRAQYVPLQQQFVLWVVNYAPKLVCVLPLIPTQNKNSSETEDFQIFKIL